VPDHRQLERLKGIVKGLEEGLSSSIKALQRNLSALTGTGGGVPPKPKRELIKALERLRRALNNAILALERKIGGTQKKKSGAKRKKKAVG